jgi:hypothetical protein
MDEFVWNDETEDWPKQSWDFHNADGTPIDNLEDLEASTGQSADSLAVDLLRLPFGKAAPRELIREAQARAAR